MMRRMGYRWNDSRWKALIVTLGFVMRAVFVHWHPGVVGDSLVYGDLAQNMLHHHVYGFTETGNIRPTLIRLPGYPAFLAACFGVFGAGNFVAVMWVQVVFDLATWWMLARLAERLWGRRAGMAALALGMLCPFTANYCAVPLTETLVMFSAVLAMVGFERWRRTGGAWLWVVAAVLVYGVLLRPDQALLMIAVVAAMGFCAWRVLRWRGLRSVTVMCVVMSLPFAFWGWRNWRMFHVVQPLAPRYANDPGEAVYHGFNRWYCTWAVDFKATVDFYWSWDGSPVSMNDLPHRAFDNEAQQAETSRLIALYDDTNSVSPALDADMGRVAEERIRSRPLRYYAWIPALKVANMWLRPRTELMNLPLDWWAFREHERASWECLGLAVINALYLGLAVVGFVRWRRRGWDVTLIWMMSFVLMRCMLLWTIDNSEMRYTLECFPMVILLGAVVFAQRSAGANPGVSDSHASLSS
jgi:4-amino-4-deoxy-L-arabinose transferase-like glycosyltransferase